MKHRHNKTKQNKKSNIPTLITYGIAACVIVACAAAAVIGFTGNNKSTSQLQSEDSLTSSMADSVSEHTELPASENGYDESGEYTPADSETNKNTDSDNNTKTDNNAKPDDNPNSDNDARPDDNSNSDNDTKTDNNTDSDNDTNTDNNTASDNNTVSDNNTDSDNNNDSEADFEIPFSFFE